MGTNITGIGNANAIGFKSRVTGGIYFPPELKDALVGVWSAYGKSNDSTDRNIIKNKIKDRGGDFVISNAAFKLNSGFGGFVEDFTSWDRIDSSTAEISNDGSKIKCINTTLNVQYLFNYINRDISSFKVKISNFTKGDITYYYRKEDGIEAFFKITPLSVVNSDKVIELPKSYNTVENGTGSRGGFYSSNINIGVTIEQIPSFEGAFVTDGVNDLITSTKTVQEMLRGSNEITVVSMIHQVKDSANNVSFTNYIRGSANGYFRNIVNNYGKTGIYGYTSSDFKSLSVINNILGDKNDYTSNGDNRDSIINGNFSVQGYSYNDGNNTGDFSSVAWYWTIIANKVLTTDQINQVIAYFNLDRTLNPDILCYIEKQGITNDNHAEFGDKLIDFSGNGRDIQLNNIAWKGDSGIGKYEVDFASLNYNNTTSVFTATYKSCSISKIIKDGVGNIFYNWGQTLAAINSTKIQVIGLDEIGAILKFTYLDESGNSTTKQYSTDGIYDLPASAAYQGDSYNTNFRFSIRGYIGDCDITITQIPSHAGALLLDGINDFGKVTGMPIYKDYTVITDYVRISAKENAQDAPILSKSKVSGYGAFLFNYLNIDSVLSSYSFGTNTVLTNVSDYERKIYYQSKYVNDGNSINSGTGTDYDSMWLGTYRDDAQIFFTGAIYSLMSFPYSMSEFLIERQLKKHKLGTLYPNMVEFRPVIKANANYKITYYQIDSTNTWKSIKVGDYIVIGAKLAFQITFDNDASELKEVVSPQLSGIIVEKRPSNRGYNIYSYITSKSPQKINITIDEYIRFEDIVQPYPVIFQVKDRHTSQIYNYGDKIKVGSSIQLSQGEKPNLLSGLYSIQSYEYEGETYSYNQLTNLNIILTKQSISLSCNKIWLLDDNEPKCILSPRLLRIPNSSYKLLGYIPDISGHGNHGVIHNSAYAEGSGVNEDGSYQFDGVDDFVTIPTTVGGKQVLMKVNWQKSPTLLYDQRASGSFAILTTKEDDTVNSRIAYQARNQDGKTYIDGIENNNIETYTLKDITHNITIANSSSGSIIVPAIGCNTGTTSSFAQMSLYDFMLFDNISTDDKILELNEYVGIEGNTE